MSNIKHFLDSFFHPKSVAIVGASRDPRTVNFYLVSNLVNLKFQGKIYPINPNAEEIMGLKAFPNVQSVDGDIDLAVISVAASRTQGILKECLVKGAKCITLTAGGFSEIGPKGREVQDELLNLLRQYGARAIGPNALSPINSRNNLAISFGHIEKLLPGNLSFIFQSGLYEARSSWFFSTFHFYLNKLIDLGNKMDINETDALDYLSQDPGTKVIAMHLESVAGDARRFMRALKETTREKPVIVMKGGQTLAGAKAASSHTGAIIKSNHLVFNTALKQSGAIQVQTLEEFFDLAKAFEYLPPLKGNKVAVATLSGGEGVIATDLCQFYGLSIADPSFESIGKVRSVFPPWNIPVNPFDIGVSSQFNRGTDVYAAFLESLADDPNIDCFAIHLRGYLRGGKSQPLKSLSEVIKKGKPLVTWISDPLLEKEVVYELESNRVPVYISAGRAIRALSALYRYHSIQQSMTR